MRGTHKGRLKKDRYVQDILRMMERGDLPRVGLVMASVFHDAWCAHWAGLPCDCEPIVKVRGHTATETQEANA